jgi:SPP1 gp7 family putative phage head morphogenesis protein
MPKQIVARAVHPNAGTAARYRRALLAAIAEMIADVESAITEQRKSDPPVLAQDASPSDQMQKELRALADHWKKHFDDIAPKVAEVFLKQSFAGTNNAMRQALKAAGWSVDFQMTPAMRDAFDASLAENVGLIRSIPAEYLQRVEGIVMRSYSAGRDLQTMIREIKALYPKAKNRAVLIARDQSNKANAVVQRTRQKELGISEAIWQHSHAGKEPRPTHVTMNGKRYKVEKGMYDSAVKAFIFPGELVNCRCTGRSVLPWTPNSETKS